MADRAKPGVTVVVLPVAHCELNPIEMCWSRAKRDAAKNNTDLKKSMEKLRKLVDDGLAKCDEAYWRACCDHVVTVEDAYLPPVAADLRDEQFVINLESDSDEDSDQDGLEESESDDSDAE
jgi:hypothetical protein